MNIIQELLDALNAFDSSLDEMGTPSALVLYSDGSGHVRGPNGKPLYHFDDPEAALNWLRADVGIRQALRKEN